MAKFISISGASTTGKTSLVESLSTHQEMKNIILGPDIKEVVWKELVNKGLFSEYAEICTDQDYLCTYLFRVVEYYNKYIDSYRDSDAIVLLDGCWLDLSIYTILNMWYNRGIKAVQEEILEKIAKYDESISRIYITKVDDESYPVDKYRLRGTMATFRANRPLEISYYNIAKHLKNSVALPSSDISESSLFIIDDLKRLGHL